MKLKELLEEPDPKLFKKKVAYFKKIKDVHQLMNAREYRRIIAAAGFVETMRTPLGNSIYVRFPSQMINLKEVNKQIDFAVCFFRIIDWLPELMEYFPKGDLSPNGEIWSGEFDAREGVLCKLCHISKLGDFYVD